MTCNQNRFAIICLVLVSILSHVTIVFAEENTKVSEKKFVLNAKGKRVTVVDFEDAAIDGQAKTPEGMLIQSRQTKQRKSFLEARTDFTIEMISSITLGTIGGVQN